MIALIDIFPLEVIAGDVLICLHLSHPNRRGLVIQSLTESFLLILT